MSVLVEAGGAMDVKGVGLITVVTKEETILKRRRKK